jgi:transposase
MEATAVYWRPVWHILSEGDFELVLANAAHIKNVPGRKTDVNDATWIADLLAHGLIRPSFVPEEEIQELRTLMRARKQIGRDRSSTLQRMHKILEDANIKLDAVITELLGMSGRAMVEAMIKGETGPERLADLADRRLKASREELREALRGRLRQHHRFMLSVYLDQIDALDKALARIDQQVGTMLEQLDKACEAERASYQSLIALLITMPGIGPLAARMILAEIGRDMSRFPSAGHLVAWAGLCPRNDESAGKRRSTRLRHGAPWLKTLLIQCAWAAVRKKDSYLRAQFHRLRARRGPKKAICAVAASMLTALYHMLRDGTEYQDLGADHFDRRSKEARTRRLVNQLTDLGYTVEIKPLAVAA